jgi:hypothetical protein
MSSRCARGDLDGEEVRMVGLAFKALSWQRLRFRKDGWWLKEQLEFAPV